MTLLADDLAAHPAVLERAVSLEIARRVVSIGARSREIEDKLDAIERRLTDRAARRLRGERE